MHNSVGQLKIRAKARKERKIVESKDCIKKEDKGLLKERRYIIFERLGFRLDVGAKKRRTEG